MKAVQYRTFGGPPEVVEIERPVPGPGQILLKVAASGLCHSDVYLMSLPADQWVRGQLPLTLGHECAGAVVELGPGVSHVAVGQRVAVYGSWGCGACYQCAQGHENLCVKAASLEVLRPGLGAPGSMAEYMLVDDARHLVDIGDLDPAVAAPLTDAGLTPYHAVKASLAKLGVGTTAVVLGVGGLGHLGVQVLKALCPARVVALDVDESKLQLALESGADTAMLVSDRKVLERIRELTGGRMADAVFDFAGFQSSLDLGRQLVGVGGDLKIVGIGMGGAFASVGFHMTPYEATVGTSYWGFRHELFEVVELARRGKLRVHIERYSIDEAPKAYEKLRDGTLTGRAVIVM
jgi:alcohol dehydrogenase, propanol-preferring